MPDIELICQSCGIPMNTSHYYGTNKDSSPSSDYCHYCYQKGIFTDQGISMDKKIRKYIDIAVKMGINEAHAHEKAYRLIPRLRRWK